MLQPAAKVAHEGGLVFGRVGGSLRELQTHIDDSFAIVARLHVERLAGAANQETAGNHERERDCDLGGDEDMAQPRLRASDVPVPRVIENNAARELAIAGASPNRMPANMEMARTYAKTLISGLTSRTSVPYSAGSCSASFGHRHVQQRPRDR